MTIYSNSSAYNMRLLVSEGLLVQGIHSRDHNIFYHQAQQSTTAMVDQDRVQRYRGCLALHFGVNSTVNQAIRSMLGQGSANNQQPRFATLPEDEWHVTLVTKDELRALTADAVQEATEELSTRCFAIGLGGEQERLRT